MARCPLATARWAITTTVATEARLDGEGFFQSPSPSLSLSLSRSTSSSRCQQGEEAPDTRRSSARDATRDGTLRVACACAWGTCSPIHVFTCSRVPAVWCVFHVSVRDIHACTFFVCRRVVCAVRRPSRLGVRVRAPCSVCGSCARVRRRGGGVGRLSTVYSTRGAHAGACGV
jgi:hypothetical protein